MRLLSSTRFAYIRTFLHYSLERDTLARSIKTALVVGTILAIINHGQEMLSRQFSLHWVVPMLITYFVPFIVATYGQVRGKQQRDFSRMATSPTE